MKAGRINFREREEEKKKRDKMIEDELVVYREKGEEKEIGGVN